MILYDTMIYYELLGDILTYHDSMEMKNEMVIYIFHMLRYIMAMEKKKKTLSNTMIRNDAM